MRTAHTITLFTDQSQLSQQPTSFVASILIHGMAIGVVSFGLLYTPTIKSEKIDQALMVRRLELRTPEQPIQHTPLSAADYPGPIPPARKEDHLAKAAKHRPSPPHIAHTRQGPQTLIQPDVAATPTLAEKVPVPAMLLWSPARQPTRIIVAPAPQKPSAAVTPSLDLPNDAQNLDDVSLAASDAPMQNLPLQASSTSPVSVPAAQQQQAPPATVVQTTAQPSSATVVSLSDLRMKNGIVVLPPVSESASSTAQSDGLGTAQENGEGSASADKAAHEALTDNQVASTESQDSVSTIALPKNGQFGAVVVGASLEDAYPDLAGLWSGRMAYTVYLHVGLSRSWTLQYSLPYSADAANAGVVARIAAPWPYNIVRPNLAPGSIGADALLIHGLIDTAGRFQNLSVVFPLDFPQTQFVLDALRQWQFRPALQNGQNTAVDVLLIIPDAE